MKPKRTTKPITVPDAQRLTLYLDADTVAILRAIGPTPSAAVRALARQQQTGE